MRLPAFLIAAAFVAACATDPRVYTGNAPGGKPLASPDVPGVITQVNPQVPPTQDFQGTVLIEANPAEPTTGAKTILKVTGQTQLHRRMAGADQRIGFNELRVGQTVEAWSTGPIARSYPGQGEARAILVISGP